MANTQLLLILVLAMVAGLILFRLYSVLGRRTGNEREPGTKPRWRGFPGAAPAPAGSDNVVALPQRPQAPASDPVAQALIDIKLADRGFETDHFLSGARKAYEMILTAYAAGDRAALKPLLSEEVYRAFDEGISGRESRHEKTQFVFGNFKSVSIVHAELKDKLAEITVEFSAHYTWTTTGADGTAAEGDASRDVVDRWTFARELNAQDPNWILVATSSPG